MEQKNSERALKCPNKFSFLYLKNIASRAGIDTFLILILTLIFLAYLWPYPGTPASPLHLEKVADVGVTVVFLLYGLRLEPEKLKAGLLNWKLHLLIHFTTFLVFPLVILAIKPLFLSEGGTLVWLAVFYLAVLPSTVSSSVVLVSIAGGNIPAAIFNASLSSFLGVFITPLWMGFVMEQTGTAAPDLSDIMLKLVLQVIAPILIGQLLHKRLSAFAETHRTKLRYLDQSVILLIIYTSFCESFDEGLFENYNGLNLLLLGVGMVALFFAVMFLTIALSNLFKLNKADKITAVFCASKKSLVQGTVMSKVLFEGMAGVGAMLLPLMLYHALQLMIGSSIAQSFRRKQNL